MRINSTLIRTAVLGGLIGLMSCQAISAPADLNVKSISVPAYSLITDALIAATPTVKGQRNDAVMQLVCDLARGTKSQQQVNDVLKQNNVDVENIPATGNALSLLVNKNAAMQSTACTAFIATSLFTPVNNSALFDTVKEGKDQDHDKSKAKDQVKVTLNPEKFAQEMRLRLAISQATAQMYAVIASNLSKDGNLSWADQQNDVVRIVARYAPQYLQSVKNIYLADQATYTPVSITGNSYDVIDSNGHQLMQNAQGPVLLYRGVEWLGNGKILGKEYFVDVRVIDSGSPAVTKTKKKR